MERVKDFTALEQNVKLLSKTIDIENDYQEALHAYNDDIYRVVKCNSNNYITSIEVDYNEIKLHIKCEVYLTYYSENSSLCYSDFEEEYTKTISIESVSDSTFINADIIDKYTNYRVINQRRIDIHSSCCVILEVYDKSKCGMLSSLEAAKLKNEKLMTSEIKNSVISKIEFDEEFSTTEVSKAIKRIISFSSFSNISEIKVIKDKILAKANVNISVLYTTDTESEEIIRNDYSFTASKIIDIRGIREDDVIISDISVGNVFLKCKSQGNDGVNVISAFGELVLKLVVISEGESEVINDGYLTDKLSNCRYSDINYSAIGRQIKEAKLFNINIERDEEIAEIKEISVIPSKSSMRNSTITSDVFISVLYINSSGELCSFTENENIDFKIDNFEFGVTSISVLNYDYSIGSMGIDIRLNAQLNGYLFNNEKTKVLADIEETDEEVKLPSLMVYFGKKDEDIWDIAKRFSSDKELIKFENKLESEILSDNKLLIIPRV